MWASMSSHPSARAALRLVAPVALLVLLYRTVVPDLVRAWSDDPDYSHGFLIPAVSALAVWRRRRALAACRLHSGSRLGLGLLAAGVGARILGEIGAELFTTRASLVVVAAGLVLYLAGRGALRLLLFPIVYLLFMVPLPATIHYAMTIPLQRFAATTSAWVLDLLGIPALLDGNIIRLSALSLGVAEACSGIRSLVSLLAVACAWSYLVLPAAAVRLLLIVAVVPIAIATNVGRVVGTALVTEWLDPAYARGFYHTLSGQATFLVGLVCMIGLGIALDKRWRRERVDEREASDGTDQMGAAADGGARSRLRHLVVATALLLLGVVAVELRPAAEAIPTPRELAGLPASIGSFRAKASHRVDERTLDILRPEDYLLRRYVDADGGVVDLYIGYWASQRRGAGAHSPKNCLPGSGWEPVESGAVAVPLPAPHETLDVNRYVVARGSDRREVLYWYHAQGRPVRGELAARARMIASAVRYNRTDVALVRLTTPVRGQPADALERLRAFLRDLYPVLVHHLPG